MALTIRRASRWLVFPLVALIALAPALRAPSRARADTNLVIGGQAVVAYANGDPVRLRAAAGYGGAIITAFPEGTVLDVLDGPVTASDGSLWYIVARGGQSGYMISDYLAAYGGAAGGDATTTTALNLRAGPSTGDAVLAVMPAGSAVAITGGPVNGFYPVRYGGRDGWAYGSYLSFDGSVPSSSVASGGGATVTTALNLRAGPSTADAVLLVMPAGSSVSLLGDQANSFLAVSYQGTAGWAYAAYLDTGTAAPPAAPAAVVSSATTTTSLNLRAGPSTGTAVLTVMPPGAAVDITGDPQSGFYPVRYSGWDGWAYGDYLNFGGVANAGGSSIVWPVSGGAWEITQGYNGFSHYNGSSTYQYHYSIDIARVDRKTAGQPVYSPVSGTVRWTERASGGMTIDLGNGYAVAFFHVTIDSGLRGGDRVSQGQYVGYVSGPGGDGYVGFPHVHLTVWRTNDGGNWSRVAVPFSGQNAISGMDFPDIGGANQWSGTVFYP